MRRLPIVGLLLLLARGAAAQEGDMSLAVKAKQHLTDPRRITLGERGPASDGSTRGGDPRYRDRLGGRVVMDGNLRPRDFGASYRTAVQPTLEGAPPDGTTSTGLVGPRLPREGEIPRVPALARAGGRGRFAPPAARQRGLALASHGPEATFRVIPPTVRLGDDGLFHYQQLDRAPHEPSALEQIGYVPPRVRLDLYRSPEIRRYRAAYARPIEADPASPVVPHAPGDLRPAAAPPEAGPAKPDVAPAPLPPAAPVAPRAAPEREAVRPNR